MNANIMLILSKTVENSISIQFIGYECKESDVCALCSVKCVFFRSVHDQNIDSWFDYNWFIKRPQQRCFNWKFNEIWWFLTWNFDFPFVVFDFKCCQSFVKYFWPKRDSKWTKSCLSKEEAQQRPFTSNTMKSISWYWKEKSEFEYFDK